MGEPLPSEIIAERENAAQLCELLAARWEASAGRRRKEGTYKGWFGRTHVNSRWEQHAKDIEAAASGLRAVALMIREGARAVELKEDEK